MSSWIEASLQNGEFFFYLIPFILLLLLLIVIFFPDKKESEKTEEKQDVADKNQNVLDELIEADKKLKVEIEPLESESEKKPFKPLEKSEGGLFEGELDKIGSEIAPQTVEKPASAAAEGEKTVGKPASAAAEGEKTVEKTASAAAEGGKTVEKPASAAAEGEKTVEKPATVKSGLQKTKNGFMSKLIALFQHSVVDDDLIEELEEILYTADMGVETVSWLMDLVNKNRSSFSNGNEVKAFLKEKIKGVLIENHKDFPELSDKPTVFLMVGVNGAGKTTTIGKLAYKFMSQGKIPMLAAGDTFRAAAVEQLKVWAERVGCAIISAQDGADPASVAFNAVNSAIGKNVDALFVDTAGRLQNRLNLMEELSKINRVIGKAKAGAPHETIIVIDANNGQNALIQAKQFGEAVRATGIIVTKLDGSAKGGIIIGVSKELKLPIYLVGVGEKIEDLQPFNPEEFVDALFD